MTHMGHFGDLVAAPSYQVRIVTEASFVHDTVPCLENVCAMIICHGRPFPRSGSESCRKDYLTVILVAVRSLPGPSQASFGCVSRRSVRVHLDLTWKICLRGRSWCLCGRVRFCHLLRAITCLLLRDLWPPPAREVRYVGKMPFQGGPAPLRKDASRGDVRRGKTFFVAIDRRAGMLILLR